MNNQIEEMAVIGCARTPQAYTIEECTKCGFKNGRCNAYRHAEALYNAGYRKIPEDSIVLSKSEKQKLLKEMYEQGRFDVIADLDKEGKVVLTREEKEEYESLIKLLIYDKPMKNRVYEVIKDIKQQTCKKTAEKIFTELLKEKQLIDLGYGDGTYEYIDVDDLEDLAKQYGVEIKE